MKMMEYADVAKQGLEHVEKHQLFLNDEQSKLVNMIESNKGSRSGCLLSLLSHAKATALVSWFKDQDLMKFKQWAYVSAKLERMKFQMEPGAWYPCVCAAHAFVVGS